MKLITTLAITFAIAFSTTAFAQTRTTPVEIKNTPTVNVANTPSVTLVNTPNVAVTNTPSVNVANTPAVTVSNIPSVVVNNQPTVKIDATANTVTTPTISSGIRLWSSDLTMANNSSASCSQFTCTGYREVRAAIKLTSAPLDPANLKIYIECEGTPSGGGTLLGHVTFVTPTDPIVQHCNFVQSSSMCIFVAPVISNRMWFYITNNSGGSITIDSDRSWVWLVN